MKITGSSCTRWFFLAASLPLVSLQPVSETPTAPQSEIGNPKSKITRCQRLRWGFYAHQRINRLAIFTLPPEMIGFYKKNLLYLMDAATNPDQRRNVVPNEAPRHFIDLESYGDSVWNKPFWDDAMAFYGEDSLLAHGIVPWHVQRMRYQLTAAFRDLDAPRILKLSAELGHYIADAHVPLHTTRNYNGQLTNQVGIHAFWESRLPELYAAQYDFYVGQAQFLEKPHARIWSAVRQAHAALDSVFSFEKEATTAVGQLRKFGYEERNGQNVRVYSRDFSERYHALLNRQVERQMRGAIRCIGDFWFTCWVEAGQPDLDHLPEKLRPNPDDEPSKATDPNWKKKVRPEE
jgi:hypothetical protein